MLEGSPTVFNRLANTVQERIKIGTPWRGRRTQLQWWHQTLLAIPRRSEMVNSLQFTSTVERSCTPGSAKRAATAPPDRFVANTAS